MTKHVVALSGGKDSTAMALRLIETEPRDYKFVITPTGDELPDMVAHWNRLEGLLETPLTRLPAPTLRDTIEHFQMLPNHRSRFCTRVIKLEPFYAWLAEQEPCISYVGLRADEETRPGMVFSENEMADTTLRFPLREWGWGIKEVVAYLDKRGVCIPERTDCARCYAQRLGEWHRLWEKHPDIYADAEDQEERISRTRRKQYTFRSPSRDTWPASLRDLRKEFEKGRVPRAYGGGPKCRVCSL